MRLFVVLFVLVFSAISHAGEIEPADSAEFVLSGMRFGQPPAEGMICTNCSSSREGASAAKKRVLDTYKHPRDITHIGSIEIAPPAYDFFQNRLLRVRIMALCRNQDCFESMLQEMGKEFGLKIVGERAEEVSSGHFLLIKGGHTSSNEVMFAFWEKWSGRWGYPIVNIYDPELMEEVRLAVNPSYVSTPNPLLAGSK